MTRRIGAALEEVALLRVDRSLALVGRYAFDREWVTLAMFTEDSRDVAGYVVDLVERGIEARRKPEPAEAGQ